MVFSPLKNDMQNGPKPMILDKFWCHPIQGVSGAMIEHLLTIEQGVMSNYFWDEEFMNLSSLKNDMQNGLKPMISEQFWCHPIHGASVAKIGVLLTLEREFMRIYFRGWNIHDFLVDET